MGAGAALWFRKVLRNNLRNIGTCNVPPIKDSSRGNERKYLSKSSNLS